jgi:hypothetical protein
MFFGMLAEADAVDAQQLPSDIPGLVAGLSHGKMDSNDLSRDMQNTLGALTWRNGGDLGGVAINEFVFGNQFSWYSMERPGVFWSQDMMTRLPPGLVLGLKHSVNQQGQTILAFNSVDATSGRIPVSDIGIRTLHGGDIGAERHQGFYWIETTGEGNVDWSIIDRLPKYTAMGLRHTMNLRPDQDNSLFVRWSGIEQPVVWKFPDGVIMHPDIPI